MFWLNNELAIRRATHDLIASSATKVAPGIRGTYRRSTELFAIIGGNFECKSFLNQVKPITMF